MFKQTVLASSIILATSAFAAQTQTQAPNTFTAGTAISATQMNDNFDAMENGINSNATQVDANLAAINDLSATLDTLNSVVTNLDSRVANLESNNGGGSFDLQAYVGSGTYHMVFRNNYRTSYGDELCAGMTKLVLNPDGSLVDGVKDDQGTPNDDSDDILGTGTVGEELCIESESGGGSNSNRATWAEVGGSWTLNGQQLTITTIDQLQDNQGRDLYVDAGNTVYYKEWGSSNNANPSQYYENVWDEYLNVNGYHGEWQEDPNGNGSGTIEIWYDYNSYNNGQPSNETWTQKDHYFNSSNDVIYTASESDLSEKIGPISTDLTVTADGNLIVKQKNAMDQESHSSELIIGIRAGTNTP